MPHSRPKMERTRAECPGLAHRDRASVDIAATSSREAEGLPYRGCRGVHLRQQGTQEAAGLPRFPEGRCERRLAKLEAQRGRCPNSLPPSEEGVSPRAEAHGLSQPRPCRNPQAVSPCSRRARSQQATGRRSPHRPRSAARARRPARRGWRARSGRYSGAGCGWGQSWQRRGHLTGPKVSGSPSQEEEEDGTEVPEGTY